MSRCEVLAFPMDASGSVHLDDDPRLEVFTEPNLAFGVAAYASDHALVRVHLSLESLPPWMDANAVDIYEYFLLLDVSVTDLAQATTEWAAELAQYPQR